MTNREELAAILKITSENIRRLHRNVSGDDFFRAHEDLERYYKMIDEISDDYIEFSLGVGDFREPSIKDSIAVYPVENEDNYSANLAYCLVQKYFTDIVERFASIKDEVPSFIFSKFEEYQSLLFKEANYFIQKRLI